MTYALVFIRPLKVVVMMFDDFISEVVLISFFNEQKQRTTSLNLKTSQIAFKS